MIESLSAVQAGRYGAAALDHLTRMYGEPIPARNLHPVMGTMLAHPRTFIISSVCCAKLIGSHFWALLARRLLLLFPLHPLTSDCRR
jgi:hypothetical protein